MTPFLEGVVFTVGVMIVLICVYLLVTYYVLMTMDAGSPLTQWRDHRKNKRLAKRFVKEFNQGGPLTQPEPVKAAMAVDPENPPSWKIYGGPRSGAPVRTCVCHPDRPLKSGQRVLWWPVPNSGGGVNVFCQDGVEVDE
jgi:hypothetical protein